VYRSVKEHSQHDDGQCKVDFPYNCDIRVRSIVRVPQMVLREELSSCSSTSGPEDHQYRVEDHEDLHRFGGISTTVRDKGGDGNDTAEKTGADQESKRNPWVNIRTRICIRTSIWI